MKNLIKQIPGARSLQRLIQQPFYQQRFSQNCYGCFYGIFETFDEAIAAAPATKSIGYDNPELAQEYVEMIKTENWEGRSCLIHTYDYPILFWLSKAFNHPQTQPTVFDFGGNIGVHYYTYTKYIPFPETLKWTVCDLPHIIQAGKDFSAQKGQDNQLEFTSDLAQLKQHIFLASGSLQYVENFADSLRSLSSKPNHLLINRLPLYDGEQFVTLQNGGKVFYPQYVFNKTAFITSLKQIGYELVDSWEDLQTACMIPFHPEKSVPYYHGLYFRKIGA